MHFMNYFNCFNLGERNILKIVSFQSLAAYLFALGLHILVMLVGDHVFEIYPHGLTPKQWGISIGFSVSVLIIGTLVKQIPYEN